MSESVFLYKMYYNLALQKMCRNGLDMCYNAHETYTHGKNL